MARFKKSRVRDINAIQNHTAEAVAKTHTITFAVFYLIEIILENLLEKHLPEGIWGDFIKAIFGAVGYYILYKLIKYVYNKIIDLKSPKFNIEGEWHHVHIPRILDSVDYSRTYLSAGETTVSRDLKDFTFVGSNYDYYVDSNSQIAKKSDMYRTRWETETSEICEESNDYDIIEIYKAESLSAPQMNINSCPCCRQKFSKPKQITEAGQNRYGVHKYIINKEKNMIICEYSDCWPSLKSGHLFLYKNKEDRDRKIEKYFKEKAEYAKQ